MYIETLIYDDLVWSEFWSDKLIVILKKYLQFDDCDRCDVQSELVPVNPKVLPASPVYT